MIHINVQAFSDDYPPCGPCWNWAPGLPLDRLVGFDLSIRNIVFFSFLKPPNFMKCAQICPPVSSNLFKSDHSINLPLSIDLSFWSIHPSESIHLIIYFSSLAAVAKPSHSSLPWPPWETAQRSRRCYRDQCWYRHCVGAPGKRWSEGQQRHNVYKSLG